MESNVQHESTIWIYLLAQTQQSACQKKPVYVCSIDFFQFFQLKIMT